MFPEYIAHFLDTYPFFRYKYIYDQIVDIDGKKSVVIVERFLGNPIHNNLYYFRKVINHKWLQRIDNLLIDRIPFTNDLYLKSLHKFYRDKLEHLNTILLHAHFGMVGYKLSKIREELGVPLVVTFYGNDISYCLKNDRWLRRYADMFKVGDRFIVLCNEARDRLIAYKCPKEKIRLWNIGLDLENYPYQGRKLAKPTKFLTVARFVETKGYPVLLKAFSSLLKDYKDITLTLVGFGPLKKHILRLMRDLKIQENVSLIDTAGFSNFYSFFKDILYTHDIFVLPSTISNAGEDEGGPALTMIYAQSTGLPVISTPFPGAEISVIDGKTGLLCKQDNYESLREKMSDLIDKASLREKMGLEGSMLVKQEFSFISQMHKLHGIYDELL
ncbi:MAG: glycosyltransferase [Candidatus Omnitrophica bacterium]|nr:glycosyltransferase [Candidatus Omnitrophota bacterium]MDD5353400.1 glycosyltransferase [Candidatus Omnitrophota bacterium]MDD5591924.1 glycosyltransferase [Candidatus Omnitrophota bacterium]